MQAVFPRGSPSARFDLPLDFDVNNTACDFAIFYIHILFALAVVVLSPNLIQSTRRHIYISKASGSKVVQTTTKDYNKDTGEVDRLDQNMGDQNIGEVDRLDQNLEEMDRLDQNMIKIPGLRQFLVFVVTSVFMYAMSPSSTPGCSIAGRLNDVFFIRQAVCRINVPLAGRPGMDQLIVWNSRQIRPGCNGRPTTGVTSVTLCGPRVWWKANYRCNKCNVVLAQDVVEGQLHV